MNPGKLPDITKNYCKSNKQNQKCKQEFASYYTNSVKFGCSDRMTIIAYQKWLTCLAQEKK
jgi:hypothetical protein